MGAWILHMVCQAQVSFRLPFGLALSRQYLLWSLKPAVVMPRGSFFTQTVDKGSGLQNIYHRLALKLLGASLGSGPSNLEKMLLRERELFS